jgi:S1-C subfamily serine protease
MPVGPTHYQVLGLARDASSIDIAHAFREKLAEAQKRPGGEDRIEAIRGAYQVLANPASRADYDATLPVDLRQKRAQEKADRGPNPLVEIIREAPEVWKVAVPVLVVFVAIVLYRVWPRHVTPPPAPVVQVAKKTEPADEDEAVNVVKEAKRATVARPLTAEEIFAVASKSVARITAEVPDGQSIGSGVVTGGGVVITNCHVVNDASSIRVKVGTETYGAAVRVADREFDLCSLNVTGLNAPIVTMASFEAKVGQRVYAIGSPQGLDLTLSEGLISALRQTSKGTIIQTSAPISPGSSGGGLFNTSAELVGIVTFQHKTGQNLNFALPVAWISEMRDRGSSEGLSGVAR